MLQQRVVPCLQLCPYDVDAGVELADIIGSIGENRQDREFWVMARNDTDRAKIQTAVQLIGRRFACQSFIARNNLDGWPAGSNALWHSTMIEAWHRAREGYTKADGILTFEADCVPLRVDWVDALEKVWIESGKQIVGHVHGDHINGNAMFQMRLLEHNTQIQWMSYQNVGWDWLNRDIFMAIGCDTAMIWQRYQCGHISEAAWLGIKKHGERPALFHGVKDGSARQWARKHLVT